MKPTSETGSAKPDSNALVKAMAKHPFLKGMPAAHLQRLAECAMFTEFAADQAIFQEGEIANRFYLIIDGEVALETNASDSVPINIETVGKGSVLGWSWLFPPYYWRFHARATKPTTAIFFYGTRLRDWCEKDHDLGYHLLERVSAVIINRLQATRTQLLEAKSRG